MTDLEFRTSVKDVWLLSHQSGEFLITFFISLLINIFLSPFRALPQSKLDLGVTPSSYVAPDLLYEIKQEALDLHWNPVMKDDVELPEDLQLDVVQNETTRTCKSFTMLPAPISFY